MAEKDAKPGLLPALKRKIGSFLVEEEGRISKKGLVTVGERVAPGATVATVGRTGRATTHHLHFEIRRAGLAYNPLYLLPLPPRIAQVDLTDENPVE